jgi:hypothetical protein
MHKKMLKKKTQTIAINVNINLKSLMSYEKTIRFFTNLQKTKRNEKIEKKTNENLLFVDEKS